MGTTVELWKNWLTGFTDWRSTCCPLFFVVQNETTLWISKIFNFLIVWRLFCFLSLSVSLFSLFFSLPESDSPLSWHGLKSLHRTAIIFLLDEHHLWLDKTNKQNPLSVTWTMSPDQSHGSKPSQMVLPFLCICVCVSPFSPLHPHYPPPTPPPLYLLFLLCGKQMKNLGRKAASACSLKRTISARGKCCNNCAAEHAHKRGDGM